MNGFLKLYTGVILLTANTCSRVVNASLLKLALVFCQKHLSLSIVLTDENRRGELQEFFDSTRGNINRLFRINL